MLSSGRLILRNRKLFGLRNLAQNRHKNNREIENLLQNADLTQKDLLQEGNWMKQKNRVLKTVPGKGKIIVPRNHSEVFRSRCLYSPAVHIGPFYFGKDFFLFWGVKAMRWELEEVGWLIISLSSRYGSSHIHSHHYDLYFMRNNSDDELVPKILIISNQLQCLGHVQLTLDRHFNFQETTGKFRPISWRRTFRGQNEFLTFQRIKGPNNYCGSILLK